jgi:hypothetical protein
LDRYIEFDWQRSVLAWQEYRREVEEGVFVVWLRRHAPSGIPIHYRIVETAPLHSSTGYVAGDLFDSYLSRPESRNVVWDEQDYGPTGGKPSIKGCIG